MAIGRDFRGTEQRVRALRLALADLQAREALGVRRAALSAQADRDAISLLGQRHSKILALDASEATLAQRRTLNAQIRAREERAAIRNTAQQLTLTRQLNREAEVRVAIQQEQALGAARSGMIRGGIMLAAGATGVGFGVHAAKAAAQLQTNETFLRAIYGIRQTAGIRTQAFQLQQQLGNLSAADIERMRLTLLGSGLSPRTAGAVLPEVARVADVLYARYGTSLTSTATQLGQFANLFGARTAAQFAPMGESLMKAALISPGSMSELLTQSAYLAPLMRHGFDWRSLIALSVTAQRMGGRGAISPENLSSLLAKTQVIGSPLAPMALGGRGYYAALQLGLPGFLRNNPNFTFGQFDQLMLADRKRLGSTQFLTFAKMLFGTEGLRTIEQLAKPQTAAMLEQVQQQIRTMGSSAQINAARLNTLDGQLGLLHSNFHSLIQVLGQPLVGPLQAFNHALAAATGGLTTFANRHQATTSLLGQAGFTTALFASAGGALKSVSAALKFAAARGWVTNAGKFAGGLDVISGALGRLFPLVMAMQVGTKAGGVVGTATMREQMRYGKPLTYGTLGGGIPVMDLSSLFGHRTAPAVTVHGPLVHVSGAGDPNAVADKVMRKLTHGLKLSVSSQNASTAPTASGHVVAPK